MWECEQPEQPVHGGGVGGAREEAGEGVEGAGRQRDAAQHRLASRHVGPLAGGQVGASNVYFGTNITHRCLLLTHVDFVQIMFWLQASQWPGKRTSFHLLGGTSDSVGSSTHSPARGRFNWSPSSHAKNILGVPYKKYKLMQFSSSLYYDLIPSFPELTFINDKDGATSQRKRLDNRQPGFNPQRFPIEFNLLPMGVVAKLWKSWPQSVTLKCYGLHYCTITHSMMHTKGTGLELLF